ncbi:MFS family permease [Streptomyces sp. SAI-144]|uniref:MFS transporter n=1 Tax=unclassified Streptomyces TaxID=2593676 RepID=UPI002473CF06|nr:MULTISPECIES: MFS transporter [unclassified Streptomyces]MDH6438561.1 MFS family permease [Streptomyces sp. SAI-144]MDH6485959.1 MFS family permease [Streptomyces sp. SAI-127]
MYLADSRSTGSRGTEAAVVPDTRPGRRPAAVPSTVLALGAVSLITDVSSEMVTAVLPLYVVAGLGLSPLGFGLLDGINNGVGALVRLAGGHLADRGGRRHKVVAGLGYGLSALCKPLLLLAHTLPVLSAVLAADRTGKGLRTAPRDAMISLASEPAHRGRAFGVHRAMDTTGALLGPLVAFAVLRATVDGYDAVFAVSGCVAVLGVLVLVLFVPRRIDAPADAVRRSPPPEPDRPPTLRDAIGLLRRPELRRLTVCAALLGLTTVSDSFLYLLLQREGDLPAHLFPLLPLGTAAFFLLLAVPLGALADRVSRRRLFLAGHGVLLLGYGLVLSPWHGAWAVIAVLVLHGTFYAATDGVLAAATAGAVPARHQGAGQALVGTGQALARFACSLAFGAAWSLWGGRTALAVTAAALAAAAVMSAFVLRGTDATPATTDEVSA